MLDPTQRESDLFNSVKKHMVDNLGPLSIPIFFEYLLKAPVGVGNVAHKKWCCCVLGDHSFGVVGEVQLSLILFTREDNEGDDMATLSDSIIGCFLDENGTKLVTYYNTSTVPWVSVGGMIPFIGTCSESHNGRDLTKYKLLPVTLKWGSK